MRYEILPRLVNGPEGDPALYAEFKFDRRALLFDIGDLRPLSARSILKVTHVFVSHAHVDHFIGFDTLLRLHLGRDKRVVLYGPPGFTDRVEAKLRGYSWNLVRNFTNDLVIDVHEVGEGEAADLRAARFACSGRFDRRPLEPLAPLQDEPVIHDEPGLRVRAALLEHDIPCVAFALEEKQHINVDKVRLEALGLPVGPWLKRLKEAVRLGRPPDLPIRIGEGGTGGAGGRVRPLGELARDVLRISRGQKVAYVTDASYSASNRRRILALAAGADIFYCEAGFSGADTLRAQDRRHLTAAQAGTLAREAGARRLVLFHFSPRYHSDVAVLYREAEAAFGRAVE